VVDQEGLQGLAEVLHQRQPLDHGYGVGGPPAQALGVAVAPIATDDRDRRMLGEPGRDAGGRAVRSQVHDAMRLEIDQDGAIAVAPPPGPRSDAHGVEG
jgi:hypothetical protein